jgi:hypothetical protein
MTRGTVLIPCHPKQRHYDDETQRPPDDTQHDPTKIHLSNYLVAPLEALLQRQPGGHALLLSL